MRDCITKADAASKPAVRREITTDMRALQRLTAKIDKQPFASVPANDAIRAPERFCLMGCEQRLSGVCAYFVKRFPLLQMKY
jgi:hypothetical protein